MDEAVRIACDVADALHYGQGAHMDSPLIVVENWFEELKRKVAR